MFPTAFSFGFTARFWSCVIRKSSNVFHTADAAAAWEAVGTALVRCEQWVGVGVLGNADDAAASEDEDEMDGGSVQLRHRHNGKGSSVLKSGADTYGRRAVGAITFTE